MIVGAGPVGLTMAAELARHGLSCRVIDQAAAPSTTSKALAIFPRTLEVFEQRTRAYTIWSQYALPCCYLIRPDGYIGFRSQPPKPDSLRDYLKTIFL